ncbi:MAG TPA: hypothetical protein VHY22_04315 [Chthoniobacteraceae bacterium]|nr:hypothetical protein [Chthoniobacteraceae bacterium]
MKPARNSGFARVFEKRRNAGGEAERNRVEERREALVFFAIAILFVANVVIYLCHHYGLASFDDFRHRSLPAPGVTVDCCLPSPGVLYCAA